MCETEYRSNKTSGPVEHCRRPAWARWAELPKYHLATIVKHTGQESRGDLCEIFNFRWSLCSLRSKSVNNVWRLLQLLSSNQDPLPRLRPWIPLGIQGSRESRGYRGSPLYPLDSLGYYGTLPQMKGRLTAVLLILNRVKMAGIFRPWLAWECVLVTVFWAITLTRVRQMPSTKSGNSEWIAWCLRAVDERIRFERH